MYLLNLIFCLAFLSTVQSTPGEELVQAINNYRAGQGKDSLAISVPLMEVARLHILDIETKSLPEEDKCTKNSWSDEGDNYRGCCYSADLENPNCMWDKPQEITENWGSSVFNSAGYEAIYYDALNVGSATEVVNQLVTQLEDRVLILNEGKWNIYSWRSVGAAMSSNYAVVWFSPGTSNVTYQQGCGAWTADVCVQDVPCQNNCSDAGTCLGGICECDFLTTNFDCDTTFIRECPVDCGDNGVCNQETGTCECNFGFSGIDCRQDFSECAQFNYCSNNGLCLSKVGDLLECVCFAGFTGPTCSQKVTSSTPCTAACTSKGVCQDNACVCFGGWTGTTCAIPPTCPQQSGRICNNHGTCDTSTGLCSCTDYWAGAACGITPGCPGTNLGECDSHGTCVDAVCNCIAGYEGADCSTVTPPIVSNASSQCTEGGCCINNRLASRFTICREADGPCDQAEYCSGVGAYCPTDEVKPARTPCGEPPLEANEDCDAQDTCDGKAKECQSVIKSATTCTDGTCSNGLCILTTPQCTEGLCCNVATGKHLPSGTLCRDVVGPCDAPDFCDGNSNNCVDNVLQGNVCQKASDCANETICTGTTRYCPIKFKKEGTPCSPNKRDHCEAQSVCTGSSPICPDETIFDEGTPCSEDSACSPEQTCNGISRSCPGILPNTGTKCTVVSNGKGCGGEASCRSGGLCLTEIEATCTCDVDADCFNGDSCKIATCSAGACTYTPLSDVICDDGDGCTTNDVCSEGICGGITNCTDNTCSGHGSCCQNTCFCNVGFSGADCSTGPKAVDAESANITLLANEYAFVVLQYPEDMEILNVETEPSREISLFGAHGYVPTEKTNEASGTSGSLQMTSPDDPELIYIAIRSPVDTVVTVTTTYEEGGSNAVLIVFAVLGILVGTILLIALILLLVMYIRKHDCVASVKSKMPKDLELRSRSTSSAASARGGASSSNLIAVKGGGPKYPINSEVWAVYSADSQWYKAKILEYDSATGGYLCLFTEYGNQEWNTADKISADQ